MRALTGVLFAGFLFSLAGCQRDESTGQNLSAIEAESSAIVTNAEREAETRRLTEWLDARYEEELQFSPLMLAEKGSKDLNDQLDDFSAKGLAQQLAWKAATVEQLHEEFDYQQLTPAGQESYDLWIYQYERARAAEPFWRMGYATNSYWPSFYFTQMFGMQSDLPALVMNYHRVDDREDMLALVTRLAAMGRAINQLKLRAQAAAKQGIRPPRFAYEVAIREAEEQVSGAPFAESEQDAPIWGFTKEKLDALLDLGEIDRTDADRVRARAHQVLHDDFLPAYQELLTWLRTDIVNTDDEARGVGALPGGEAFYRFSLKELTSTDMTPDQLHQLGLKEVTRIRGEMDALREEVQFEGDLQEFFTYLREDSKFLYPNTDAGRESYLSDSRAFLKEITKKLPDYFGLLPKTNLVVKRVEPHREQDGGIQHYFPGSPDGAMPGVYYAHLSDMNAYSKADMESIAYHEGNPGHHLQFSIQRELSGVPKFRTHTRVMAYSEGWGLYAEQLAEEMGAFHDPYKRFGRLNGEMWRAVRLVVDTGLHAKDWSEEQAVQYFLANTSLPEAAARFEVRRYLVWPGQATAYKVGMLKILELRTRAMETLGGAFDIRGFHDAVLGGGALPLNLLEKRVQRWVDETAKG
ncbi:DUF885 domain-containing protein [Microbulbifer guangxiensis]|uniref:DUF885 domain-containing protein n=1 Tax=Microbulbifer guangxiensis TaxID=2904249 RepID=UPI001F45531C|nr:DUF885 domain-containing protein [Microbulbifer guangxiensis]